MAPKYLTRSIRILLGSYIGSLASSFPDRILFYPGSVKDPEQDPVPVQEPNRIMDRILCLCRISYRTLQYPKGSYKILQDRTRSYRNLQDPTRSYRILQYPQDTTISYRILQDAVQDFYQEFLQINEPRAKRKDIFISFYF